MDLFEQMRTFTRVVEAGSLSAAARDRGLSLAATSRQLGALEAELGATLIVRTTRRLQITEPGRRWYEHCVRVLASLEDARADVAERGAVRGTVVISAPITLGVACVVPRLERLAREHPRLVVDLRLEDHPIDLVADNVDVAVRGGLAPPDSPSVIAHDLGAFRRVAVAAPAYLARRGTPKHPSELARHDILVQHGLSSTFSAWRFVRGDELVEVRAEGRLHSTAPMVLRDWAAAGAGIALLPQWLVPKGRAAPLRRILPEWTTPEIGSWALHRIELRGARRIRVTVEALSALFGIA